MASSSSSRFSLVSDLTRAFKSHADKKIAQGQKAYMRNQFSFYGLQTPLRRQVQSRVFESHQVTSNDQLCVLIRQLWNQSEREYQYSAMALALKYKKLWVPETFDTFELMIREKSWWDTVDAVASNLIGSLITKYPQELGDRMDLWIEDDYMWARRTALIHQLYYKEETDESRLFGHIKKVMHEKEFFIRKAIGWALRQYSKTRPEAVRDFIEENRESLSALSIKEGSKYC